MNYSFKDTYTRARVAIETDKYVIYQTLKSKLYFSGNYLLIKQLPDTIDKLDYYIEACRDFFSKKGVDFVHLALTENDKLDKKLRKYLLKNNFNEINFDLYHLALENFVEQDESAYTVEVLQKKDYANYLDFHYKMDLEMADEKWANHNKELLYDNIRSEKIMQLVAKDEDKIIGVVNVILKDDFFELDELYVAKKYRKKGIANHIMSEAIKIFSRDNVILVADSDDTPKYMYEKFGFRKVSSQSFYLKSKKV